MKDKSMKANKGITINVRFTKEGCGYDPYSKTKLPRSTNVIYHPVFWDVSRAWAKQICSKHRANIVVIL